MQLQPIKTINLPLVTNRINNTNRFRDGYGGNEYPATFFPADNDHPYQLDKLVGYAFKRGNYRHRYIVEEVDEEMACYKVKMDNKPNQQEPSIKSLVKLKNDHMETVYPLFVKMLEGGHEAEMKGIFLAWSTGNEQSLLKGFGQFRYDGMPWQYRFTAVIYGLGLAQYRDELLEYMESRIRLGLVSLKFFTSWAKAREKSDVDGEDVERAQREWKENSTNKLPTGLLEKIKQIVAKLPDEVFPVDYHAGVDRRLEWQLFLGPDLFDLVHERVIKNNKKHYPQFYKS